MDKNRLIHYARYDLTIHRAFYRNLALTSAVLMLSITLLGFFIRWWEKTYDSAFYIESLTYTHISGTVLTLLTLMGLLMTVYAACFNHPLANRQSRLKTLTLPATNGEKFLWHALLVTVGGAAFLAAVLLLCDALNALLSLLAGFERIYSLTAGASSFLGVFNYEGLGDANDPFREITYLRGEYFGVWLGIVVWMAGSAVWNISAFVYGNAIKYRYNILWTILTLWLLQTVVTIVAVALISLLEGVDFYYLDNLSREDGTRIICIGIWVFDALLLGTAGLMWWRSWVRYCRAQITSRLNR